MPSNVAMDQPILMNELMAITERILLTYWFKISTSRGLTEHAALSNLPQFYTLGTSGNDDQIQVLNN
jgi:hypothetical protein